jgi:hypothetical protein
MKKLLVTLVALLVSASSFAQGTLIFNNRTQQGDRPITYGAGPNIGQGAGSLPGAFAQLYLVTGTAGSETFTALTPSTPFRTGAAAAFFTEVNPFTVPGVQPGASARFQVRAWQGAASYDAALTTPGAYWGTSQIFTEDALGGTPPGGGLPVPNPTPDGMNAFTLVPEPSTVALGVLGAAALLFRRRK